MEYRYRGTPYSRAQGHTPEAAQALPTLEDWRTRFADAPCHLSNMKGRATSSVPSYAPITLRRDLKQPQINRLSHHTLKKRANVPDERMLHSRSGERYSSSLVTYVFSQTALLSPLLWGIAGRSQIAITRRGASQLCPCDKSSPRKEARSGPRPSYCASYRTFCPLCATELGYRLMTKIHDVRPRGEESL